MTAVTVISHDIHTHQHPGGRDTHLVGCELLSGRTMVSLAKEQQNRYTTDLINCRNLKINMILNYLFLTLLEYDYVKFKMVSTDVWQ